MGYPLATGVGVPGDYPFMTEQISVSFIAPTSQINVISAKNAF